jgi:hypothetical protein
MVPEESQGEVKIKDGPCTTQNAAVEEKEGKKISKRTNDECE